MVLRSAKGKKQQCAPEHAGQIPQGVIAVCRYRIDEHCPQAVLRHLIGKHNFVVKNVPQQNDNAEGQKGIQELPGFFGRVFSHGLLPLVFVGAQETGYQEKGSHAHGIQIPHKGIGSQQVVSHNDKNNEDTLCRIQIIDSLRRGRLPVMQFFCRCHKHLTSNYSRTDGQVHSFLSFLLCPQVKVSFLPDMTQ